MPASSSSVVIGIMVNLRGQAKLDALNAALKALRTNIQTWQKAQASANTTFQKFSVTAADTAKNMAMLRSANAALAAANAKLAGSQQQVYTKTQNLTKAQKAAIQLRREEIRLDNLKIKSTDNLATRLRKVETAYDSIFRAGFRLQMLGNDMEQLGRKTIEALGGMVSEFGDFEFMLNRAAGAMGILQTETDKGVNVYERFQSQILKTAGELRLFKPEEVAKATYFWASTSGQQVDTLQDMEVALKAVNPLMKIAALTQTDYETAIKGVYSIIVQYGKGLDDVQDVTEKLQKTTVETAAEFPDLINSFKMVGPIAKANNVSFEDMIDLFGKLADAGIRGSMSGRAFRQFFIQLVKPSEIAKKALDGLFKSTKAFGGKSYTEMVFPKGEFIGVTKYVTLLATALKDQASAQRLALLARITTANELPVLTALVDREITSLNTNADAWSKGVKTQETAAQAFKRQWDILANSWNGLIGAFQRGVDTLQILIGSRIAAVFGPVFQDLTKKLGDLADWFANDANKPIIDFFVKLTGAAGGLLLVAGFATKLAGALTALGAASMVAIRAFGPLLAKVGVVGSVIAGLASAVQRNFEYIQEAIVSAFNDINDAFGGSENAVQTAGDAFKEFAAITRPIFDFIVRSVADMIRSFGSLIKILMGFAPTQGILEAVGKIIIFVFSAKTIANVLGLAKAFTLFNGVVAKTAMASVMLNNNMRAASGATGVLKMGFKGLMGSAKGLLGALGPGAWIVIGAAIAGITYEAFPPLKEAVDRVAESFRDFKKDTEDALAALDLWRGRVEVSIFNEDEYKAMAARLKEIVAALNDPNISNETALKLKQQYDQMTKDMEDFKRDYAKQWSSLTTELRESGINVTQEEILTKAQDFQKGLGLDTLRDAIPFVKAYFTAVQKGTDNGTSALSELEKAWRNTVLNVSDGVKVDLNKFLDIGLGPGGKAKAIVDQQVQDLMNLYKESTSGGEGFAGWTDSMRAELLSKLVDMRNEASPELAEQINGMLDSAVRNGVVINEDDLDAASAEVAQVTSDSLLQAFDNLKDFDKKIADLMKRRFRPLKRSGEVFASFLKGAISKGFVDASGATNYPALLFAQEQTKSLGEAFKTAFDAMTPPDAHEFARKTIKQFNDTFKKGVPKDVPPELRQELQDYMTQVYAAYGVPVPQEIIDKIWGSSKEAGMHVPQGTQAGVEDPTSNKNLQDAATTMRDDTLAKLVGGTTAYNHGKEITDKYGQGASAGKPALSTTIASIASMMSKISPPLASVFTWGQHLIQKFLGGMLSVDIEPILRKITHGIAAPLKFSEPKVGPLRNMHESGQHYVQNFLSGMESMQHAAQITATNVAESLALNASSFSPDGVTFSSDNRRVIEVQIEVTSPDGSVDRIKTAQLQQAIQTSELVLALEHMATVG